VITTPRVVRGARIALTNPAKDLSVAHLTMEPTYCLALGTGNMGSWRSVELLLSAMCGRWAWAFSWLLCMKPGLCGKILYL
jgi:hypothetical protein